MAIIVSKNNKNAEKLDKQDFGLEQNIQEYIYDNPNVIPLYEIDSDIQLFVAAREFSTGSGPIDALAFDGSGNIYVVETKLYRNPDKRTVVAQALDYGASLWRHSTNFDDFTEQLNRHTQKQFSKSFQGKYAEFFGLDDVSDNMVAIADNLNSGNIKFVVLMDKLHSQLKDLIVYINQNSQFDIYAVEVEYYKHAEFEIVIPKLFGAEVKKDVISRKQTAAYHYTLVSKQAFSDDVNNRRELDDAASNLILELLNLYDQLADKFGGKEVFYHSDRANRELANTIDADGKAIISLNSNGEVWFYGRNKTGEIADYTKRVLNRLIDEQLLEKTEKNLAASQWSVRSLYFQNPDNDNRIAKQINRFVEISKEELR